MNLHGDPLATNNLHELRMITNEGPEERDALLIIDAYLHHKSRESGRNSKWTEKPDYTQEGEGFAVEIEDFKITLN